MADDLALADRGDGADGDRLDDGRELFLDDASDALGTDRAGPDADRAARGDMADPGPIEDAAAHLHDGRPEHHLHSDRGGLDDPTDSLGTRLARLRRAVGDGLRSLREGLDRLGDTLDRQIQRELAGLKDCVALLIRSQAASMKALSGLLNDEASYKTLDRELAAELDLSESRRREIEGQLDRQEAHAERGLRH